jgi:hypothetical protein
VPIVRDQRAQATEERTDAQKRLGELVAQHQAEPGRQADPERDPQQTRPILQDRPERHSLPGRSTQRGSMCG